MEVMALSCCQLLCSSAALEVIALLLLKESWLQIAGMQHPALPQEGKCEELLFLTSSQRGE